MSTALLTKCTCGGCLSCKGINTQNLSNVLTASPFTEEGCNAYDNLDSIFIKKVELNDEKWKNDFLEQIYAEPFFLAKKYSDIDYSISFAKESEEVDDDDVIRMPIERYDANHMRLLKDSYIKFRNELIGDSKTNFLQKTLYTVIGAVGSGKSIFTYRTLWECREKIHCFDENFETKVSDNINFISTIYRVKTITPIHSFILILMNNIGRCFSEPRYSEKDGWDYIPLSLLELRNRISNICEKYNEKLKSFKGINDNSHCISFFDYLQNIPDEYCNDVKSISEYILKYMDKKIISKNNLQEKGGRIEQLTDILYRLYFCLYKTGTIYGGKKFVLFIDNIEFSLKIDGNPTKAINWSHLKLFLSSVRQSAEKFNKRLSFIKENIPAAIVLAMRDCTLGILDEIRDESFDCHRNHKYLACVEIAEWFDDEDIANKRIKYFTKYNSLSEMLKDEELDKSQGVIAYYNIINDRSRRSWGLYNFITSFYSNSKRFIHERLIGGFLSHYEEFRGIGNENELKIFNKYWEHLNSLSKTNNRYNSFKHLCRKYIIRLLFDYVNKDKHNNFLSFKNTYKTDGEECSYARRILTHLSTNSKSIVNIEEKPITYFNYVNTGELIDALLVHGGSREDENLDKRIELFSDVLFELNKSFSNWAGLVYIQIPSGGIFNDKELLAAIKDNWKEYKKINGDIKRLPKTKKTDIKLTLTGDTYAAFMPDFENFASRYCKDTTVPLLFVKDSTTLKNQLNYTFNSTIECVKRVNEIEDAIKDNFISWNYITTKGTKRKYAKQLCVSHMSYLLLYKNYLNSDICMCFQNKCVRMPMIVEEKIREYERLPSIMKILTSVAKSKELNNMQINKLFNYAKNNISKWVKEEKSDEDIKRLVSYQAKL
ncbi:MAG: hypothetical protein LBD23_01385 [Oscillospiraceae bacterium]|jgi:hypothetical protein|nr:hypothetical protein [Oscillospiraceae bacterium]